MIQVGQSYKTRRAPVGKKNSGAKGTDYNGNSILITVKAIHGIYKDRVQATNGSWYYIHELTPNTLNRTIITNQITDLDSQIKKLTNEKNTYKKLHKFLDDQELNEGKVEDLENIKKLEKFNKTHNLNLSFKQYLELKND